MRHHAPQLIIAVLFGTIAGASPVVAQVFGPTQPFCTACLLPVLQDADADGDLDAWVLHRPEFPMGTPDSLFMYVNDGSGAFAAPVFVDTVRFQGPDYSADPFKFADVDGDGDQDLLGGIWTNAPGDLIDTLMLMRKGPVGYTREVISTPNGPNDLRSFYPQDMDGDGDQDLVVGRSNATYLLRNNGAGIFTSEYAAPQATSVYPPFDWDGDGDLDLIGGDGLERYLMVSYNVGVAWGFPWTVLEFFGAGGNTNTVADVNNDGLQDYVVGQLINLRSPGGAMVIGYADLRDSRVGNVDCEGTLELLGGFGGTSVQDLTPGGFVFRPVFIDTEFQIRIGDLNGDGKVELFDRDEGSGGKPVTVRFNLAEPPPVQIDLPNGTLPADTVLSLLAAMPFATPVGGFFSGPGVYNNVFYAMLAGTGPYVITYHYTDPITTCIAEASDELHLQPVGLEEFATSTAMKVIPNPSSDRMLLHGAGEGTLKVVDVLGRPQIGPIRIPNTHTTVDVPVADLGDGLYVVVVENRNGQRTCIPFVHRTADQ
ncbi:MAG: VCBS repeat-containing protein [Flavobacteriales bacterium]|nr:VCBS repeat-containing protein [Flavobacteriales bacterium]